MSLDVEKYSYRLSSVALVGPLTNTTMICNQGAITLALTEILSDKTQKVTVR